MPGSSPYEIILRVSTEQPTTVTLNYPLALDYSDDTSDLGTGYQEGRSLVVDSFASLIHSFTVTDGSAVSEEGPHSHRPLLSLRLLGVETPDGVAWRVNLIEFPSSL